MRVRLLPIVIAATLAGCLEGQAPPASEPREEALAFGLEIVGTYFASDGEAFRAKLDEPLYTLEGEGPITLAEVDAWMAADGQFPSGRDYTMHTIEEYLGTYAPRVMSFEEARAAFPEFGNVTWEGWTPDADDWIFVGGELREGKQGFLWDDLLAFAVTNEGGAWRFKAFSG